MSKDILIKVEGVHKKYCKSLTRSMFYGLADISRNLVGMSSQPHKLRKREFWAVDNANLEIKRGEAVGLIGPNGSGKTTLLKMINGIFWPDQGRITVKGRVGALIAVSAGFHPMLTGRENIYLNGAILGMSKRDIDKKFDTIVDFADVGEFLDSPVKHYSSGMYVRLGFAVAAHCEPDILLVDEVLAVGDMNFQVKCYQKMFEVKKRGTTVILVSHNIPTIREQTTRCMYLNQGKVRYVGPSEEATDIYIKDMLEEKAIRYKNSKEINNDNQNVKILGLKFYEKHNRLTSEIESGAEFNAVIECEIKKVMKRPIFGVNFYDDRGFQYCANSYYENAYFNGLRPGRYSIKVNFPNFYLPYNHYLCSVVIADENPANLLDWHNKAYRLLVKKAKRSRGSLKIPTQWQSVRVTELDYLQDSAL
jgi:lipopolysaccharide transport system ATP-binding protein